MAGTRSVRLILLHRSEIDSFDDLAVAIALQGSLMRQRLVTIQDPCACCAGGIGSIFGWSRPG